MHAALFCLWSIVSSFLTFLLTHTIPLLLFIIVPLVLNIKGAKFLRSGEFYRLDILEVLSPNKKEVLKHKQ